MMCHHLSDLMGRRSPPQTHWKPRPQLRSTATTAPKQSSADGGCATPQGAHPVSSNGRPYGDSEPALGVSLRLDVRLSGRRKPERFEQLDALKHRWRGLCEC